MLFKRPVDSRIPVSARYGARGPWWNWYLDDDGKWQKGQIDGIGQHKGIDFATTVGTPVFACVDGEIEVAGYENPIDHDQGFGLRIRQIFTGPDGREWRFYYGHLSKVEAGAGVYAKAGDRIALSGDTGHTTGPHLHIEIRDPMGQQHPILFYET